jgi:PKD repeat protein
MVLFTNTSSNAQSYQWFFGDGASSTGTNPYHIYSSYGNYTVMLVASNGTCPSDTLIIPDFVQVTNQNSVTVQEFQGAVFSFTEPVSGNVFISFYSDGKEPVSIRLYDLTGRLIKIIAAHLYFPAGRIVLPITETGQSIYLLSFTAGTSCQVIKLVNL